MDGVPSVQSEASASCRCPRVLPHPGPTCAAGRRCRCRLACRRRAPRGDAGGRAAGGPAHLRGLHAAGPRAAPHRAAAGGVVSRAGGLGPAPAALGSCCSRRSPRNAGPTCRLPRPAPPQAARGRGRRRERRVTAGGGCKLHSEPCGCSGARHDRRRLAYSLACMNDWWGLTCDVKRTRKADAHSSRTARLDRGRGAGPPRPAPPPSSPSAVPQAGVLQKLSG